MELHKSAEYTRVSVCVWGGVGMWAEYLVNHTKENVCEVELNQHNWILQWRVLMRQNVVSVHVPVNSESSLPLETF